MRARTGAPSTATVTRLRGGQVDEEFIARAGASILRPKRSEIAGLPDFSVADGAATLSALTAAAVARVVRHLPTPPQAWIIAGGGARNPTLMRMLAERLKPASVETAEAAGWSSQSLEAEAFGYLAVRTVSDLPITFPHTTGIRRPMAGGVVVSPRS